ncbi:tRNA-2-methylthio-N(6)-dimethylallyladenosine synthase [uncultured archaeon]|nr:tRNA-2-methylthio-N(6)-dimethylallyladenosine synthase [uncultured archaeon]
MEKFVFIETYGCSANQNNSEIIAGLLKQAGYELTNNEKIAEILIINTCIVKGKTESKIKRRIQDLSREFPDKLIVIAGCMPETDKQSLVKINSRCLLLGLSHTKDIVKLIRDYKESKLDKKKSEFYLSKTHEEKICSPKISNNKLISIIQISEGCLGSCSYCKTKLAKGPLFSYPEDKIIKSIESDLQNGAKEIWITSQDNASYYLDRENKSKLPELLNKILSLKYNFRLRLGMINPNNLYPILNEMIDIYKNKKMYKFLHIPIQSGSDKVLKDMNRPYKIEAVKEIIKKFKIEIPDITIATDIITGYPTETEEDHKKNIELIKEERPDVFNLSKFSSHKQTESGKLTPLKKELINKRATALMELHRKTALDNKEKFKDREIKVFVNNKTKIPNTYEARDDNYNIVLVKSNDKSCLGKNINVKISQIGVHHMIGEII